MINFVNSTFPFATILDSKGHHVNDICRDPKRDKKAPCCSFVFLSALSFSSAMILARFPDFIEHMAKLDYDLQELLHLLEQHVRGSRNRIPPDLMREATKSAGFLYENSHILNMEHPITDIIIERLKTNVHENLRMDDIIESINVIYSIVMHVCGGGYSGRVDEARSSLRNLSTACRSFRRWVDRLQSLKKNIAGHIWASRSRHLGVLEVPDKVKEEDKQKHLEKSLIQKMINMVEDEDCVFRHRIDLGEYKRATA